MLHGKWKEVGGAQGWKPRKKLPFAVPFGSVEPRGHAQGLPIYMNIKSSSELSSQELSDNAF